MIDSLIYNRTKFVKESEYIKRYVGRTITKGANVYTYTFHSDGRFYGTQVGNTTDYQSTGTIAYQVDCGDGDVYVAVQSKKTPQFFKLSEFLQNGGVSHSHLIHLYHAVSRFRKEISMAIDHLIFNKLKWCSMSFDEHSINMPNKVKTKLYQAFINMKLSDNVMTTADTGVLYFLQPTVVNVVGKITVGGKTFYQIEGSIPCTSDLGGNVQDHSQTVTSGIVIADNVDVIRGGKTYLTHW